MLLILLCSCSLISLVKSCTASDRAALLAVKSALNEPYLGIFKSWTGDDCCTNWYGVNCNPDSGRVTNLNLRGESQDPIFQKCGRTSGYMTGSISPEICKLDSLTSLVIADWKGISGEIPSCIPDSLTQLHELELVGNRLTGHIPANIGKFQKLKVLNFADNVLTGEIPTSVTNLGGSLMHLDLRGNQLTGQIPADFGKLGKLSRVLLSRNQLTGTIPSSITTMARLADLDLSTNKLTGSIPDQMGKMTVLSVLNLDSNDLSGTIPGSLLSDTGLNILNVSHNRLEGYIPDVFGAKSYFTALDLSYNNLKGHVPASLSKATYVGHLDLSHNHLCGSIPTSSPFDSLDAASFADNDCLCGNPLRTC
ncbi:hypothetical protein RDABS01_007328 [Bienertia sinuspersici]